MYLLQNELPNLRVSSNKLDGSFLFYPKPIAVRLSVSLLVLLYLSYVNLFKELFLFAASSPETRAVSSRNSTPPRAILVLLEVSLLLESGCKGMTFIRTAKTFRGKCLFFDSILTLIYIILLLKHV